MDQIMKLCCNKQEGDQEVGNVKPSEPANLNVNRYATEKTTVAGVMNLSLLASNANQLRLVMDLHKKAAQIKNPIDNCAPAIKPTPGSPPENPEVGYCTMQIAFISLLGIAIVLQLISAICIIAMGSSKADLETSKEEDVSRKRSLNRNNKILLGISTIVTVINVLAAAIAQGSC